MERGSGIVVELSAGFERFGESRLLRDEPREELGREVVEIIRFHLVGVAAGHGEDEQRLLPVVKGREAVLPESGQASVLRVVSSRSEPNCVKEASSRYWARPVRSEEATCFMSFVCAAPPTRETERPTLTAGRWPSLKRSVSRKIWPSVMEMTFVGM